jgi:hypothetical protein
MASFAERTGSVASGSGSGGSGPAWLLQPKCTPDSVRFFLVKKLDIKVGELVAF